MTRVLFVLGKLEPRAPDPEEQKRHEEIARLLRIQTPLAKLLDRPLASYRLVN